ncbi:MAG: hypothetical protein ACI9LN_002053 [Saprospiraceae bacterium]|jgi:hypothetical protein
MAEDSSKVLVNDILVRMKRIGEADFVCISDIAQSREGYPLEYIRSYLKNY